MGEKSADQPPTETRVRDGAWCLGAGCLWFVMAMLLLTGVVGVPVVAWQLAHQDNSVARRLHDSGRSVTATECERHVVEHQGMANAQGRPNGGRRPVTHEVDAVRVQLPGHSQPVELAQIDELRDDVDTDTPLGWQPVPSGADYACPLQVVVDANDPTVAMDQRDVFYFGTSDSRNFLIGTLVVMAVFVIGPGSVLYRTFRSTSTKDDPPDQE